MWSGSDGLYLSPLSDMSPATSDCLKPYFSGGGYFIFQLSRVCRLFWVLLFLSDLCTLSGKLACDHGGRRSRQLDQYGC